MFLNRPLAAPCRPKAALCRSQTVPRGATARAPAKAPNFVKIAIYQGNGPVGADLGRMTWRKVL